MDNQLDRERAFKEMTRARAPESDDIRQRSPLRLHAQIRSGIRRGVVGASDRLDEDSMVRTYSTSRNAVRAALALLAEEGIVSRERRHGTIVMDSIEDIQIGTGNGWNTDETFRHAMTNLGSSTIPTTPLIAGLLRTSEDTVRVTQFVDFRDGVPFLIYINYAAMSGGDRQYTSECPSESFEVLFERAYKSPLARIDCSVQAVSSDERTARLLNVAPGTALMLKERLLVDATGTPREFSHTYYIASRVALTTTTWTAGHSPPADSRAS